MFHCEPDGKLTYGKFDSVLQFVVGFQLRLDAGDICFQAPELIDFHQLAGHHTLTRWLPVSDLDLVARHPLAPATATHVFETAAY